MKVEAEDADDPDEPSNTRLVYSIAKNAVSGPDGRPMFSIEPETGVIRTNVCCLNRETAHLFFLQVVAMDAGGLRGERRLAVTLMIRFV